MAIIKNILNECMVESCVRKMVGAKTPSSFLIERTCRYAKINECRPKYSLKKRVVRFSIAKIEVNTPLSSLDKPISRG